MTVTDKQKANLKPFVKGYDPRRAVARVPKTSVKARELFRRIGAELMRIKERNEAGETVEYDITRIEAAIRMKFSSKAPKDFETILKALYPGLLKDEIDQQSVVKQEVVFRVVRKKREKPNSTEKQVDDIE
jgi:hypothetical protein